jgi:hypothetical protein
MLISEVIEKLKEIELYEPSIDVMVYDDGTLREINNVEIGYSDDGDMVVTL